MKKNSKIIQFSSFLLRSGYAIYVKIWQWLKPLHSFSFIKKTLVNYFYISIWLFWLTFTAFQRKNTNFKISQFSGFLLRYEYAIQVKIWKWLKLLNSLPYIRKTLVNQGYIRIWFFSTDFHSFTVNEENLQNYSIFMFSAKVRVCETCQSLKMTKTSEFSSIHQENTCKSSLHWNLMILTDLHSFTVNEEELQN